MEAAFLATLSSAPAPSPGGRRHSVVTISRVPPTSLFGRGRRESIAAFGSGLPPRFPRKDSTPSMSGSNFNLQLDIMDDIAEIKAARKVKLKMWQTENEEKICEVSEGGSVARYHQKENRRFSDVTGILPPKEQNRRRASEAPPTTSQPKQAGIVCTNTDLITMMSSLTSSAQEINSPEMPPEKEEPPPPTAPKPPTAVDEKRHLLKSNRSNSFDVSLLPEGKSGDLSQKGGPGNWFIRRHVPMACKKGQEKSESQPSVKAKPLLDRKSGSLKTPAEQEKEKRKDKVLWDKPSGSIVDPQVIGSAIEVFLTKRTGDTPTQSTENLKKPQKSSWFSGEPKETDEEVSCDNSICSTLKDLFVK